MKEVKKKRGKEKKKHAIWKKTQIINNHMQHVFLDR